MNPPKSWVQQGFHQSLRYCRLQFCGCQKWRARRDTSPRFQGPESLPKQRNSYFDYGRDLWNSEFRDGLYPMYMDPPPGCGRSPPTVTMCVAWELCEKAVWGKVIAIVRVKTKIRASRVPFSILRWPSFIRYHSHIFGPGRRPARLINSIQIPSGSRTNAIHHPPS